MRLQKKNLFETLVETLLSATKQDYQPSKYQGIRVLDYIQEDTDIEEKMVKSWFQRKGELQKKESFHNLKKSLISQASEQSFAGKKLSSLISSSPKTMKLSGIKSIYHSDKNKSLQQNPPQGEKKSLQGTLSSKLSRPKIIMVGAMLKGGMRVSETLRDATKKEKNAGSPLMNNNKRRGSSESKFLTNPIEEVLKIVVFNELVIANNLTLIIRQSLQGLMMSLKGFKLGNEENTDVAENMSVIFSNRVPESWENAGFKLRERNLVEFFKHYISKTEQLRVLIKRLTKDGEKNIMMKSIEPAEESVILMNKLFDPFGFLITYIWNSANRMKVGILITFL
jgi:hypothetical protein